MLDDPLHGKIKRHTLCKAVDLMIDQGDLPWQSFYCIMIMTHSTSTKDKLVLTIRATDNAVSLEGTKKLVAYLEEFAQS